jgi:hypothetical protein
MAYTVSKHPTVFGNKAAVGLEITADDATQTIETGLKRIDWTALTWPTTQTPLGLSPLESLGCLGLPAAISSA